MSQLETPLDVLRELLTFPEGATNEDNATRAVALLSSLEMHQLDATLECLLEMAMTIKLTMDAKAALS